jgi:hypothetical protein
MNEPSTRLYVCKQCKWVSLVPILYFTCKTVCPLCFNNEHFYSPREHYPIYYRTNELFADINYRSSYKKDKLLSNRGKNHWSYIYKNYLYNVFRNFKDMDKYTLDHIVEMLTGVYR